ncbi:M61 family peptidase [Cyanobium gracile UHCC 0139]|uniref:M61 family peptidase n=1 Tax=Cyanobium gracile UHCC 0139 TaxID=3110308 RepID=A0ABU5RS77_9CYAN|nr:M61 family peptidase [Cyanobium gracile]MEA5390607.1 M61 family peptidase [Cyanobium gracile UHCC 0139]
MPDDPPQPDAAAGPVIQLDLREPHRHLVQVTLLLTPRCLRPELQLPAWTPGSYLIRDHVRNLEGLEVIQGDSNVVPIRVSEACWRLPLTSLAPLVVRYRLQATELTVRTCHLSADHGFLALAGVVLEATGERWNPHRLELLLPEGWQAFIPLPAAADGAWIAGDYDRLIDAPVEAGPHPCHRFSVAGVPHRWVTWGGDLPARDPAWLADVERIALTCCRLMGETAPASDDYLFVLHLLDAGFGGLEHDHASVLQYGRRALAAPGGRRKLLQLVAHEYLHQWNVRRLKPAELTPLDYGRATIVSGLWFAEGVTSYLDLLLPLAAGVGTEADLLEDLGADLSRYLLTPGRRVQGLRQSAEEAWVKLYRQDASSADSQISYYLKGAVVALVLDLHLRRHGSSLGMVLRGLWRSHGAAGRGYTDADLVDAFADQAPDLAELLPLWLESTDDPDLDAYLADVGLALRPKPANEPFLGWQLEEAAGGSMRLKRVHRDGPAERACLQAGDELLALDDLRLRSLEDLALALAIPTAAAERQLLFCRDGRVRLTGLQPDSPAIASWQLVIDPERDSALKRANRQRWLSLQP